MRRRFNRTMLRKKYGPSIQNSNSEQDILRTNLQLEQLYQANIMIQIKSERLKWTGHIKGTTNNRLLKIARDTK